MTIFQIVVISNWLWPQVFMMLLSLSEWWEILILRSTVNVKQWVLVHGSIRVMILTANHKTSYN